MSTLNLTPGSREDRQQVEAFTERKRELREKLSAAQTKLEQARLAFADERGSATGVAEAVNERDRIQRQLEDVEQGHKSLLGRLAPGGGQNGIGGVEFDPNATLGVQFADPEFQAGLRRIASSTQRVGDIQLGEIERDSSRG